MNWSNRLDVISGVAMTVAAVVLTAGGIRVLTSAGRPPVPAVRPEPSLPTVPVSLAGAAIKGDPQAPVVLLEYTDLQCPVCVRFAREALPTIEEKYVRTGKVRVAIKHFPLERIHPLAAGAARAAECARQQGRFWQVHDAIMDDQDRLQPPALTALTAKLGLEKTAFNRCLTSTGAAAVQADLKTGATLGVNGTPSLFVGVATESEAMRVTHRLAGFPPIDRLTAALDGALDKARDGASPQR